MNPLTLDARGIRTDWPKEHLQTQAGVQENQHANRRKEESMSSASRKWIICKTMCRMNQLGSMKLKRSILTPPKWPRGACVNEILWLPWIYQSKVCNLQLCFGQKCVSWSCKNQNCPDTKGSMWLLSEKKKKKCLWKHHWAKCNAWPQQEVAEPPSTQQTTASLSKHNNLVLHSHHNALFFFKDSLKFSDTKLSSRDKKS